MNCCSGKFQIFHSDPVEGNEQKFKKDLVSTMFFLLAFCCKVQKHETSEKEQLIDIQHKSIIRSTLQVH